MWVKANLLKKIEVIAKKRVFIESNDQSVFKETIRRYKQEIVSMTSEGSNEGAVLMGVCRGKLSEGIDFSDDAARCVIVFGIPYPNYLDPLVILKKHFLNEKKKS